LLPGHGVVGAGIVGTTGARAAGGSSEGTAWHNIDRKISIILKIQ